MADPAMNTPMQSPAFDVAGARKAGYSDGEIAGFLAQQSNFDIGAARKAGYGDGEIVNYLADTLPALPASPPDEQPEPSSTVGGVLKAIGQEAVDFAGSLVGGAGNIVRGTGAGIQETARDAADRLKATAQALDDIDQGKPAPEGITNVSGIAPDHALIASYIAAGPEQRAAIRRRMDAGVASLPAPEQTPIGKAGQALRDVGTPIAEAGTDVSAFGQKTFPLSPEEEARFSVKTAKVMTGLGAYLTAGEIGGLTSVMGLAGVQGFGDTYDAAKKAGKSDEVAAQAGLLNGLSQAGLMTVPVGKAMEVMDAIPKAFQGGFIKAVTEMAKSGVTLSAFSQLATLADNVIAKATYDPKRDVFANVGKGIPEEVAAGALVPGLGYAAGAALRRVRREGGNEPSAPPEARTPEESAAPVIQAGSVDEAISAAEDVLAEPIDIEGEAGKAIAALEAADKQHAAEEAPFGDFLDEMERPVEPAPIEPLPEQGSVAPTAASPETAPPATRDVEPEAAAPAAEQAPVAAPETPPQVVPESAPTAPEQSQQPGTPSLADTTQLQGRVKGVPRRLTTGDEDAAMLLAANGGIRNDEGHDLIAGRGLQQFVPGLGPLIRKTGLSIDAAGELLWDHGFFGPPDSTPRPTENEVLQLLERTRRGADNRPTKVFPAEIQAQRDEQIAAKRAVEDNERMAEEVRDVAHSFGEPLNDDDVAQIMANIGARGIDTESAVVEHLERKAIQEVESDHDETAHAEPTPVDTGSGEPDFGLGESLEGQAPVATGEGGAGEAGPAVAPDTGAQGPVAAEPGAEGFDQTIIPGAEQSARQLAQSREASGRGRMQPRIAQREADEGLFGKPEPDDTLPMFSSAPREYRKAAPTNNIKGAFSPEFDARRAEVNAALRAELDRLGLKQIDLKVPDYISADGVPVDGVYWRKAIAVALNSENIAGTLDHEAVHALRGMGLFTKSEWSILRNRAIREWRQRFKIDERYAAEHGEDALIEEAVADAYKEWAAGNRAPKGTIASIFNKVRNAFVAIRNALRGLGFQSTDSIFAKVSRGEIGNRPEGSGENLEPAFSRAEDKEPRRFGVPREADPPISSYSSADEIKIDPNYKAAKAGDREAAGKLVTAMVKPETVQQARDRFGPDAIYTPVIAEEASGRNKIPEMLAHYYATATGARVADDIAQSNRAFHTGGGPMERLLSRPRFDGPVEKGGKYVLVDDVSVMGGSIAELANHIRQGGGDVIGVVTLANAGRSGLYAPKSLHIKLVEGRFGNEIRQDFGIEPGSLTANEAQYLANFRDADALRAGIAKARSQRNERLRAKGLFPPAADGDVSEPLFSRPAPHDPLDLERDQVSDLISAASEGEGPTVTQRAITRIARAGLKQIKNLNILEAEFPGTIFPRTLASLDDMSAALWRPWIAREEYGHATQESLRRVVSDSLVKLPAASRDRVYAGLELARKFNWRPPDDGRLIRVRNTSYWQARKSKVGDDYILTPQETKAFHDTLRLGDEGWKTFMTGLARREGWNGPADPEIIRRAANEAGRGSLPEGKRLLRLADMIEAAQGAMKRPYFPAMRFGDYYIAVRPKIGADEAQVGGYPKVEWFETVEKPVLNEILGKSRISHGEFQGVKDALARIKAMKKPDGSLAFPEDSYEFVTGDLRSQPGILRQLNIPAVEKLFMMMERGVTQTLRDKIMATATPDEGLVGKQAASLKKEATAEATERYKALLGETKDVLVDAMYNDLLSGWKKHASLVPGYSDDFDRSIGTHVGQVSRNAADLIYRHAIEDAYSNLQSNHPHFLVREYWQHWRAYQENPRHPLARAAASTAQIGATYVMGMNPSTTFMIQAHTPIMAVPVLSVGGGPGQALAQMARALRETYSALSFDKDHGAMIDTSKLGKTARERALIADLEKIGLNHSVGADDVRALNDRQAGMWGQAAPAMRKGMDIAMSNISVVDQANRNAIALAVHRMAMNPKMLEKMAQPWLEHSAIFRRMVLDDGLTPENFTKFMMSEAAGSWGRTNQAPMMRGMEGSLLFTLHGFQTRFLSTAWKLMKNMGPEGKVAAGWMMATLWAATGIYGLPFTQDLENAATLLWKKLTGVDPMIDAHVREFLEELGLGKIGAEILLRGPLSVVTGLDLSSRMGFGDIITESMTGADFLGTIPSIMLGRLEAAWNRYHSGQGLAAAGAELLPAALRNPARSILERQEGQKSQSGTMLMTPKQVGPYHQIIRALGLPPLDTEQAYARSKYLSQLRERDDELRRRTEMSAANMILQASKANREGDHALAHELTQRLSHDLAAYNRDHWQAPVTSDSLNETIRQMLNPELQRTMKLPRALRHEAMTGPYP